MIILVIHFMDITHLSMTLNCSSLLAPASGLLFLALGNDSVNIKGYKQVMCYLSP